MEHTEALRLHAAEKYLLGELTSAQSEEYEEHYFDCSACADELKATAAFMESAKQVVRERAPLPADEKVAGWLAWLRPAFAVPAFAALALLFLVVYQNTVTIPSLQQQSARAIAAETFQSFSLISAGARGEGSSSLTFKIRPDELFSIDVDMPGNSSDGYQCQIQDDSGRVRLSFAVSSEEAKNTVHVKVPGGSLQPGKYSFVIGKGQAPASTSGEVNAVSRLPFAIEFKQ